MKGLVGTAEPRENVGPSPGAPHQRMETQGERVAQERQPKPDAPATDASGDALEQIETHIENNLPESLRKPYLAIIVAGRQLMFSEKTFPYMEEYLQKVKSEQDIPKVVSHGIVKLIAMLFEQSRGKLSIPASGSAAVTLMTYALRYIQDALNLAITKPIIEQTTMATVQGLFALYKVDQAQVRSAVQRAASMQSGTNEKE